MKKTKEITKQRLKEDLDKIYEDALSLIKRSVAGEDIPKGQLASAWKVLEVNCRLSPTRSVMSDDEIVEKLAGKPSALKQLDDDALSKLTLQ